MYTMIPGIAMKTLLFVLCAFQQGVLEGNLPEILEFQTKFLQGLEVHLIYNGLQCMVVMLTFLLLLQEAMTLEMDPLQVPPGSSVMKVKYMLFFDILSVHLLSL